jgi:hypothetical protein
MWSFFKLQATVVLASALLLFTTPASAALKTKPGANRVKSPAAAPAARFTASSRGPRSSRATRVTRHGRHAGVKAVTASKPRFRGQQAIDSERTLQIQQALIREHYLDGEATGTWDQATRDALTRFQSDNHWQTKVLPDARALIKLGLGPRQQNLLNPESAAMAMPSSQSGMEKSLPGSSN